MQKMCSKAALETKGTIVDQFQEYQEAYIRKKHWFVAMVHLRRTLRPEDPGEAHDCWHASKNLRHSILEFMEKPKCEVFVLFLVLGDMVMVIIEIILDHIFKFESAHGG